MQIFQASGAALVLVISLETFTHFIIFSSLANFGAPNGLYSLNTTGIKTLIKAVINMAPR